MAKNALPSLPSGHQLELYMSAIYSNANSKIYINFTKKLNTLYAMPDFSEDHFGMPGQIRGLSVGAGFLKMKIKMAPTNLLLQT